jgi:hypothetical protein
MTGNGPDDARQVRDALGHVVIDADAHHVEVSVAFADFVRDHGGGRLLDDPAVRSAGLSDAAGELVPSLAERRRLHLSARPVWWTPSDTLDYATVAMPALYHERLQEAGIDFAVVYPSRGLTLLSPAGRQLRSRQRIRLRPVLGEGGGARFVSLGAAGTFNHVVGVRAAGCVVAVNTDPAAPIFGFADVGVVGDWNTVLPELAAAIAAT